MALPPVCDSAALPCLLVCLSFLQKHFPLRSLPSGPLGPSVLSQQQTSPWECSTIPMLQFPATVPSRGPVSLSGVRMAVTRIVCVILIPFRLSQISCFTLSLKCFFSILNNCPAVGIGPLLQFPYPLGAGPVLTLLFFPLRPSSY